MSRSYGPGRYDPRYEEGGQDYPIGFVRWTEKRNMEAFLDLLSSGALQVEPLLAHHFPVEEGEKAYAAVEAGAYTGIIDYHAPRRSADFLLEPSLPVHARAAAAERQTARGMHRRGRICAGDHLSPSALLCRADAGVCCQQHGRGRRIGAALALVSHSLNRPPNCLPTPTWTRSSSLPGTTAMPPMWRAPLSEVSASLSKSRWRSIASSWRWCERLTQKPWRKTDRLFSWWVSIAASRP